jgi:hypothetical protein
VSAGNNSAANPTVQARNSTAGGTAGNFTGDTALNVENNGTFGIGLNATVIGDTDGNGNAADDGNDAIFAQSDDTNNDAVISAFTAAGSTALSHEAIETSGFLDVNGNAPELLCGLLHVFEVERVAFVRFVDRCLPQPRSARSLLASRRSRSRRVGSLAIDHHSLTRAHAVLPGDLPGGLGERLRLSAGLPDWPKRKPLPVVG